MNKSDAEDRAGDTKQSREDWIASVIAERDLYKGECALLLEAKKSAHSQMEYLRQQLWEMRTKQDGDGQAVVSEDTENNLLDEDDDWCPVCGGDGFIMAADGDAADWCEDTYSGPMDATITCRHCNGMGVRL